MKRKKLTPCEKCPLYEQKEKYFVKGEGDYANAYLMLIGEAPGAEEAKQKIPFVGASGKVLRFLLAEVLSLMGLGLPESEVATPTLSPVYITNAVKCWPGKGNPTPPVKAISLCREAYLEEEIRNFGGKKLIALGATATHSLLRKKRRQQELIGVPWEHENKLAMSTWHPAYYLRNSSKQILLDIKRSLIWGLKK